MQKGKKVNEGNVIYAATCLLSHGCAVVVERMQWATKERRTVNTIVCTHLLQTQTEANSVSLHIQIYNVQLAHSSPSTSVVIKVINPHPKYPNVMESNTSSRDGDDMK